MELLESLSLLCRGTSPLLFLRGNRFSFHGRRLSHPLSWRQMYPAYRILSTIAEILGHTSLESTRIYAKADVEALRDVALDPEEVTHVE
jgi:integrase